MSSCHIFATDRHIFRLQRDIAGEASPALHLHSLRPYEPLDRHLLDNAQCVVLEVDPQSDLSLERMERLRRSHPSLPLIVATENADLKLTRLLLRQGVFDVVSLPFDVAELLPQIMEACASQADTSVPTGSPMASIFGATGGVGATTVITHLAAAIARDPRCPRSCCIVDLDLQFGDVANYFGVTPSTSVLDLLEAGERLDDEMVRDAAIDTGRGPFVLGAPSTISPIEEVDIDRLLRLLELVRQRFDFVLLDLPGAWTNWALSAAMACRKTFVLTDQTINGIRQAKRCLELFRSVEIPVGDVGVIVNRMERRLLQGISTDDIENALGREVVRTLSLEKSGIAEAQDQGLLLEEVARKARFSRDVADLAADLCERLCEAKP